MKIGNSPWLDAARRRDQDRVDDIITGRKPIVPHTLINAVRHEQPVRLIFDGLQQHYFECLTSGRLEAWKAAAHSAIDLLGSAPDDVVVHSRATLIIPEPENESELNNARDTALREVG